MEEEKTLEELNSLTGNDRMIYALHMIDDVEGSSIWNDDRDDAANHMLRIARVALRIEQP